MDEQDRTRQLVGRAQAGDREAFDQLAKKFQGDLGPLIRSHLGPGLQQAIDVEDVVQEAFLRAFESLDQFTWQSEDSFLRWITRIAVNVIRESARREKKSLLIPLNIDVPDSGPSQSRATRRKERFDRLQAALAGLSPDHRQVILLTRIQRLPIKEVARRMDRSPEAITQLLWRAMQKLKTSFGDTDSLHLPDLEIREGGECHGE